jgi:signal transduction histidine kinase
VDVRWEVPGAPLRAAVDKQMLRRVLINLVRNAVQALRDAKKGRGQVQVSAEADEAGIAISVEDDGPGVPEEMRDRIFDPYFTTKSDGTGLGLAIVKKIVVEHGGSIDVSSSPLGGARFVIHLPAPHSLAIAATRPPAPRPSKRLLA